MAVISKLLLFLQNAVEEYVYEIRGRIHDELEKFISDDDRDKFSLQLEDTENWLYEEGEDCKKQIYLDKLAELKVRVMWCFILIYLFLLFFSLNALVIENLT